MQAQTPLSLINKPVRARSLAIFFHFDLVSISNAGVQPAPAGN
jgi:hypothetical protein